MRRTLFLLALLPAFMQVGCHHVDGDALAKVGSESIRIEAFQTYLSSVSGQNWEVVDSRVASRLLDQYLEEETVFFLSPTEEGTRIPQDPAQRWHLLREIVQSRCGPAPTPSPEEIDSALKAKGIEKEPEQVLLRQLLLPDETSAIEARKRLDAGEKFEALSSEISIAPNASRGGILGWVEKGTQPEVVEAVIFSLKKGEISRPVKGPGGYHLFQLLDYREAGIKSTEELRTEIAEALKSSSSRRHFRQCIDRIVTKAGVTVFPRRLWFEYSGKFREDFHED